MSTLPSKEVSCFSSAPSFIIGFMQLKFIKKECRYRLTWQGWVTFFISLFLIFGLLFSGIYSFLAPTTPPHRGLLIIEGWIHDDALDEAICLYNKGSYSKIICTGIPIETGNYLLPFHSYSELTAQRLYKKGIETNQILIAVGKLEKKDRTYLAAVALKKLLKKEAIEEKELHLMTTGPHGRRSRLLFQKALGKQYRIGITSLPDASYDPKRWYAYSKGVRAVIDETIAYVYAKFLFHPAESESK